MYILTNCPSSIPMTQACNASDCTSPRRLAGTAAIVYLKNGQDRAEKRNFHRGTVYCVVASLDLPFDVQNV